MHEQALSQRVLIGVDSWSELIHRNYPPGASDIKLNLA